MYDAVEAAQPDTSTLSENQFRDCVGMTSCLPQLSLPQSRPGVSTPSTVWALSVHLATAPYVVLYYINTRHLNIAEHSRFLTRWKPAQQRYNACNGRGDGGNNIGWKVSN